MTRHALILASAVLLIGGSIASAQNQMPRNYDSSGTPQDQNRRLKGEPRKDLDTTGQAPRDERFPADRGMTNPNSPAAAPTAPSNPGYNPNR